MIVRITNQAAVVVGKANMDRCGMPCAKMSLLVISLLLFREYTGQQDFG